MAACGSAGSQPPAVPSALTFTSARPRPENEKGVGRAAAVPSASVTQFSAFLWTLVLEAPAAVVVVGVMGRGADSRRAWLAIVAAVVGSCVTHPFVWWANEHWARVGGMWLPKIGVLEISAVAVEAVAYAIACRLPPLRAVAVSAMVNAFSFFVGWALFAGGVL